MTDTSFNSATHQLHGELGTLWRDAWRRAAQHAQCNQRIESNPSNTGAEQHSAQRRRLIVAWRIATVVVSVVPIALALHVLFNA